MKRIIATTFGLIFTFFALGQQLVELQLFRGNDTSVGTGAQHRFGSAVDIKGNFAVVGARAATGSVASSGAAYVFELQAGQWQQVAKLTASGGMGSDFFGVSVSIDGDIVCVGATGVDGALSGEGAVYVFEKPLSGWIDATQTHKITPPSPEAFGGFGNVVDLQGDELLISASNETGLTAEVEGNMYVFKKAGADWTTAALQATITTPLTIFDALGTSAVLQGDVIASGAITDANAGSIHIFEKSGADWLDMVDDTKTMHQQNRGGNDNFGSMLTLSDDFAVSVSNQDQGNGEENVVHVFNKPGSTWASSLSDPILDDYSFLLPSAANFGHFVQQNENGAIQLVEDYLIVGAGLSSIGGGTNSGSVLLYRLGSTAQELDSLQTINGAALQGTFGTGIASEGSTVLVSSPGETRGGVVRSYHLRYEETADRILCAGELFQFGTQTIFTDGTYNETFVASDGLDSLVTLTVTHSTLSLVLSRENNACFGDNQGEITVIPVNGLPPYEYSIDGSNFVPNNVFTDLLADNYSITIRDALGCELTGNTQITEPDQLQATSSISNSVGCNGESNGSIEIIAIGGTGNIEFSVDGTNFGPSPITGLAAGSYDVTAKDQSGCERIILSNFVVIQPAATKTPTIATGITTTYGTPATGLTINPDPTDTEATHFYITSIDEGTLYLTDGTTQLNEGDFITLAEGAAGLVLDPTSASATVGFSVQAAADTRATCIAGMESSVLVAVAKQPLTVTASDYTVSYGTNQLLDFEYSGFVNGEDETDLISTPSVSSTYSTTTSPGNYAITLSGGSATNYDFVYVDGTISVEKALLTVEATDSERAYGDANPTFEHTYTGFVNGENETALDAIPTSSSMADEFSAVGTYDIILSGGSDDNYQFQFVDGTLTVNKGTLTVSAVSAQMEYGDVAFPAFSFNYSGFSNGEDQTVIDTPPSGLSTTALLTSDAGIYDISVNQDGADDNYEMLYVAGDLTISKATLGVSVQNVSKTYGEVNPVFALNFSGFVHGDVLEDLSMVPIATTLATQFADVGTYIITLGGGQDINYAFDYTDGQIEVLKAELLVSADDQTIIFGDGVPVLSISFEGFLGSDDATSLDETPTVATTATQSSDVGTYVITLNGGTDNNYNYDLQSGTLTITQAAQSLTFDAIADVDLAITNTLDLDATASSGLSVALTLLEGDGLLEDGTLMINNTGTFMVEASQSGNDNFSAATPVTQSFLVTDSRKTDQTITFVTIEEQEYGDQLVLPGTASSGLAVSYVLTAGTGTIANDILTLEDVGSFTVIASQEGDVDFNPATDVSQTFTVAKADLMVAADDQVIDEGNAIPTLTFSYSGFKLADAVSDLDTPPTISTPATGQSAPGDYAINLEGGDDNHYTLILVDGTLSIEAVLGLGDVASIEVFPNPAAGQIVVNGDQVASIQLIDFGGKTILNTRQKQLDLSSLSSGTYLVVVKNSEGMILAEKRVIRE